jgi:putative heme iron utilization protein
MERPSTHGGGESGPPVAGDPSSFPTDAELARTLVAGVDRATLSTLTPDGYPYGSAVSISCDADGSPVVLVSEMAEHTQNAHHDSRASFLVAAEVAAGDDPLGQARLTVLGRLLRLEEPGAVREAYLERHPYAAYYADFTDFAFWRLEVERVRFVGGFGHMSWVTADEYRAATVDPLADAAAGIVAHMNDDHATANLTYVRGLAGLPEATEATMVGADRYGVTLRASTPEGPRLARVRFGSEVTDAGEARAAVITLLAEAREALGEDAEGHR